MGIESKKAPPLPAPTETESESVVSSPTELPDDLASEADKTADQESSFSLPDDGTPITIKTRGHHKPNRSQTSLLIEYFETTKTKGPPKQGSSKSNRRPSVRVRLAPSKHHDKSGHIQITETKSSGKSSMGRRNRDDGPLVQHSLSQLDMTDPEDSHSYASATEESNVSRQPIEVDIDPSQYRAKKDRKVSSPLIPATDSKASSYVPPNMSDISAIPTDSFLDGETGDREERRSRSPLRTQDSAPNGIGSVAAAAAAAALEKKNRRPRSESHDRRIIERAVEKASRPESKRRSSKSRRTSIDKGDAESRASARRKSRNGHKESLVSAADSSVLSSQLSPSHRSYDSHASSKVSINNPKLLETVEDAIRRLILPELSAIKRERSVRETRQPNTKESLSSLTSVSREELSAANKRKSADTTHSTKSRGREARNDLSPRSSLDHTSVVESIDGQDDTPRRAKENLEDPAFLGPAAAAAGAMGSGDRSRVDDKRQRRRRRAKTPERGRASEEYRDMEYEVIPPMPLASEVNPSEITRTSILSADSDRPHSASEEMTPVREVPRGVASMESIEKAPTPTRTPLQPPTLQVLGAQHANISHGDLKALPRQGPGEYDDREYIDSDLSQNYTHEQYDDEYDDDHLEEPGMYERGYFQQDVPPPLRYVPYQQERRGLSPIQSVSGYTENESDLHHRRDSRATQSDMSSPVKSISSHMRSREFGDDVSDLRSSGYYQDTQYTDGSDVDRVTSGQAVQGVGANPQIIHQPFSTESAVASLIEPSLLSAGQRDSQVSYDSREGGRISRGASPTKRTLPGDRLSKTSAASQEFSEYDLDEYGRKVPRQQHNQNSPSPSEAAIISRGFAKAAAAIAEKEERPSSTKVEHHEPFVGEGVSRNRSFKERTKNGYQPNTTPRHSIDRLSDYDQPTMGASGLPDSDHPMPEIGWGYDQSNTPSLVQEPVDGSHNGEHWSQHTPTQERTFDFDRAATPKAGDREGHGMGVEGAAAAAAVAAAAGMATAHSRQPSQDQDDEWQRSSMDRKRDTLVTNPYEGTSPIANLPGLDGFGSPGFDPSAYRGGFNTGSPGMHQGDEGYETSAPNDRDMKGKGVEFQNQPGLGGGSNDPFFAPKHTRQMSGLSQGMDSQFYDASTGNGIDRIESTDIIALMEHLMVRDAQRSARDQELIQTVVQITREMHTSFRDMKRALAESEDQIIGEVQGNTEKTVQRHLGGPRPLPGSASRSLQGYSQNTTLDDLPAKKRGLFRRALKGLNNKGTKDLTRIEDMLMHLLTEVDVLKHQTGGAATLAGLSTHNRSVENLQSEGQYEQDRGYEPEGNAGTSTASHASQSGHLSIPQGRGSSGRMGYDRKFSDHRISTVDEGPEDEYDRSHPRVTMADEYSNPDLLMSPAVGPPSRAESVPLATPPPAVTQNNQASMSNENTPATDNSKKHKSTRSSGFLPKISRWSETTTSSIGRVFRNSGQSRATKSDQLDDFFHPPSRSGSNLDQQEQYTKHDPYGDDKLNSGYSEPDLMANSVPIEAATPPVRYHLDEPPQPSTYMTPEDPKYKAHRNSVNLQHPQPRPGQTERFRTALESSAINYDSPMSPKSADWAGSATSLHRFPGQQSNRYSDQSAADEYRNAYQSSPSAHGPPRPPKEPLDSATPPRNDRVNKLQKKQSPSPLAYQPMDGAYTTSTQARSDSFRSGSGSPKPENKNLGTALNTPARRPSGPRAMTPSKGFRSPDSDAESIRSAGDQSARDDRRRKRDTFGSVARPDSAVSQESETF